LDANSPGLKDTPARIAKLYCDEIFSSLKEESPDLTTFPNEGYNEIIMLDNIPFCSSCEHHLIFFYGVAHFLYIPDQLLVGASKVARLIDYCCKQPQIQERLTMEILNHFCGTVKPAGAMFVMRGIHGCMSLRGVKTGGDAGMMTSALYGSFKEPHMEEKGLSLIALSHKWR